MRISVLLTFVLLSINSFASSGKIVEVFPENFQGNVRVEAQRMFDEAMKTSNSPLSQVILKLYQDNVAGDWALPIFPISFEHVKLTNAIMLNEGNDSMSFGNTYIFPLHASVGSKYEALVGWVKFSVYGEVFGSTTVEISIIESNL